MTLRQLSASSCAVGFLACSSVQSQSPPIVVAGTSKEHVADKRSCLKDGKPVFDRALPAIDLDAIAKLVHEKDGRPLVSIRSVGDKVEARTGTDCGFLSGHGLILLLEKRAKTWIIIEQWEWES